MTCMIVDCAPKRCNIRYIVVTQAFKVQQNQQQRCNIRYIVVPQPFKWQPTGNTLGIILMLILILILACPCAPSPACRAVTQAGHPSERFDLV